MRAILPVLAAIALPGAGARAQTAPPPPPGRSTVAPLAPEPARGADDDPYKGRVIEEVRIQRADPRLPETYPAEKVRLLVRSREGDRFDPVTAREDQQKVLDTRRFADVKLTVESAPGGGVAVVFTLFEQQTIKSISFRGNNPDRITDDALRNAIDLRPGEALDDFRVGAARQAIERLYKGKNFPFTRVAVDPSAAPGDLVFVITEGPETQVRQIEFVGNRSFTDDKLLDQVKVRTWFPIFRAGTYDAEQLEDDVAAVQRWYDRHGFFDARVGRKLTWSVDQTEVGVTFVIEEGVRYKVDQVSFKGNQKVSDAELLQGLKMVEGRYYDYEVVQRDVRQIVRAYSPLGYIYQPGAEQDNPDYLRVRPEYVLRREAGTVGLVYEIGEGRPFYIGTIGIKGNEKTQDKVFLRELRVTPGQLYNAGEIQDAQERIRGTRLASAAAITPIGQDPETRDLLVEVQEARTGGLSFGAAVTSTGGLLGNISYEERNFDIGNWPTSWDDITSQRAFRGAGQYFRVDLEPGTEQNRATITFREPWLFDQPYSLSTSLYYRDRNWNDWDVTYGGASVGVGHRFRELDYHLSVRAGIKGEDVSVHGIDDEFRRAPEVVALKGHSTLTSALVGARYDTTDSAMFPTRGSATDFQYEFAGALGGEFHYHKLTASWRYHQTVDEDLLDRKTVLTYRVDSGYITGDVPFFERFYGGGGVGSNLRGFKFRGVSPRAGLDDDPIGGSFMLTGSLELNYPIAGEFLRGVAFVDAGTVEDGFKIGTFRSAVGLGVRLTLPIFGQIPLALDFAYPVTKSDQDDVRVVSFSLGGLP